MGRWSDRRALVVRPDALNARYLAVVD